MQIARFTEGGRTRLGRVTDEGQGLVDLGGIEVIPHDLGAALAEGDSAMQAIREAQGPILDLDDVTLRAPIARPPKFLGIGLNYADHVAESRTEKPEHPLFFNKQSTCVIGPGEPIHVPAVSSFVDYEGELGVVIGRRCRHVPADRALEIVAGYLVVNDVSVRDWQFRVQTMTMGKSFDTHGPTGPWLVTPDEVGDPQTLRLTTDVNGERMQDANTADMLYSITEQIEHLSTAFTLEPGDIISTGTPAGVGMGREPPVLLRHGSVVRIEIERIGVLENPVIDEPRARTQLI